MTFTCMAVHAMQACGHREAAAARSLHGALVPLFLTKSAASWILCACIGDANDHQWDSKIPSSTDELSLLCPQSLTEVAVYEGGQPTGKKRKRDALSFFSWLEGSMPEESQVEIAEIIKEQIWPNPLAYYQQATVSSLLSLSLLRPCSIGLPCQCFARSFCKTPA